MKNTLEPDDIQWRFMYSLAFEDYHASKFIDEEFGLEMEKISNIGLRGFGKPKVYFFITGQEKEYVEIEELCKDWNEIKNFDDPNNEIFWEKKIVKIINIRSDEHVPLTEMRK